MNKSILRMTIGISIIITHFFAIFAVFFLKSDYLVFDQKLDIALLLAPITAAYCTTVVKSAIERQELDDEKKVNLNYAAICVLVTGVTIFALIWTVLNLKGLNDNDKRLISLYEIAFGSLFGLFVSDLFAKIEKIEKVDVQRRPNS